MGSATNDIESTETVPDIAVTVIGGYLGAGKTTLVNHLLRTADSRIAVLVNDFGDINIDEELIASQDGNTISLANGCICCSLVDGFSAALETIHALEPRPERLVIESSGVADPAGVAAYGHGPGLTLDATVVVVDAETVRRKARDPYVGDTVIGQLGSGDILVMNKIDLVSAVDATLTEQWLQDHCPEAVIFGAIEGAVDPVLLFGIVPTPAGKNEPVDHQGHQHSHADSLFDSWSWTSDSPLKRSTIEQLMTSLPDEVVRLKGLVILEDDPERIAALQRVGKRWTLRAVGLRPSHSTNKLVMIGYHGAVHDQWLADQLS